MSAVTGFTTSGLADPPSGDCHRGGLACPVSAAISSGRDLVGLARAVTGT